MNCHVVWEIEKELGMVRSQKKESSILNFPIVVQSIGKDSIFICDPQNLLGQSFIVNKEGKFIWIQPNIIYNDQLVHFRYIKMITSNTFLCIDQKGRRIIEFDKDGKIVWEYQFDENTTPISADRTLNGNTLVLDSKQLRIVEINFNKELTWEYTPIPNENVLIDPCIIQALPNDNILIVDEELHSVFEISRNKKVIWRYGDPGNPGETKGKLTYPQFALRDSKNNTLICDSQNHRIVEVNKNGRLSIIYEIIWIDSMRTNLFFLANLDK